MFHDDEKTFSPERRLVALQLLAVIQAVKAAVQEFEDGKINLEDAVQQIKDSVSLRMAA